MPMQQDMMQIQSRGTTVVDVTYLCDAKCRYCRWGDGTTPGRVAQDLKSVLIPADTLALLGTKRIVLSGGEPRLHPHITDILGYYGRLVDHVVVITNGYGLDRKATDNLLLAGATGITVSLDSVDAMESFLTRRTPPALHGKMLRDMAGIAGPDRNYELGINCTVSHVTANWITVHDMLEFGAALDVDFVKFQPIFDDGYVSGNSPDLLLGMGDAVHLLDIASRLDGAKDGPPTNPPGFWIDVAVLAGGGRLSPCRCSLDSSDAISVDGKMGICFWVESSRYGPPSEVPGSLDRVRAGFETEKQKCDVDFSLFLQIRGWNILGRRRQDNHRCRDSQHKAGHCGAAQGALHGGSPGRGSALLHRV